MTRATKTPQARAEEALCGVRRLSAAYLAQNPDLPKPESTGGGK